MRKTVIESLDELDIAAVAKSRVSRAKAKVSNYWMIGVMGAIIVGLLLQRVNSVLGIIVALAGVAGLFYFMYSVGKEQKASAIALVSQWMQEKVK